MRKVQFVQSLKRNFYEFRDFNSLVEYYADYEYPESQQDLYRFWKQVLKYVNVYFNNLQINQKQIYELFRIHNLQPKPLHNVIKALYKNKQVFGLSQIQKVYSNQNDQAGQQEKKGIVGTIFGYFFKPKKENIQTVDHRLNETYYFLRQSVFKNTQVHQQQFVIQLIKMNKHLNQDYEIILNILQLQQLIKRVTIDTPSKKYGIIIFSGNKQPIKEQTIQLETTVFQLKLRLGQINHKIQQVYPQINALHNKAKQMLVEGNKKLGKDFFNEKNAQQKFMATLINKRQIINNTLNQLSANNINLDLVSIIKTSQDFIRSTAVDIDTLEDIKMSNEQIQFNLNQADQIYKQVAGNSNQEDQLYKQLEAQLNNQKPIKESEITTLKTRNKKYANYQPYQTQKRQLYE